MKRLRSFGFAISGLKYSIRTQANFKIHLLLGACAILLGFGFRISETEWLFVLVCSGLVLFSELMNTAVEKLCDVVHPGHHPGIKMVKDIGAAAVLVSAITSAVTGAVIFLPRIIHFIS